MTCTKPRASSAAADPRDILAAFVGLLATGVFIAPLLLPMVSSPEAEDSVGTEQIGSANTSLGSAGYMIAGYFGYPHFLRSNVHLTRSNGTDLQLHNLSWDGEPFFPPFYGGARVMRWGSRFGTMIDFIHNKAVARLGQGGHGRKIKDPFVEEVEATGTFKDQPAPATIKLNEILDRLEFTHGHNTLLFTGLMRLGSLSPRVMPYVGIGIGASIPHAEIWLKGEPDKTNEYQLAGPAVQALAGLEFRLGRISYFIEYKFTLAWNRGELTGGESWFNADLPGDLWRQAKRWWIAEKPKYGGYSTILAAHQLVGGVGVRLIGTVPRLP